MADSDWRQSPDWSAEAQAEFEEKLRRSRDKGESLRIKGIVLLEAGDPERREAARRLLQRALEEHSDTLLAASWAHEHLGDAYALDGVDDSAEACFRNALAEYERMPNVRGRAELKLAALIVRTEQRRKYQEAERMLDSFEPSFKVDFFEVCALRARLAAVQGRRDEAAAHAAEALAVAADHEPQLPRHPDVGNVDASPETLEELRRLAET